MRCRGQVPPTPAAGRGCYFGGLSTLSPTPSSVLSLQNPGSGWGGPCAGGSPLPPPRPCSAAKERGSCRGGLALPPLPPSLQISAAVTDSALDRGALGPGGTQLLRGTLFPPRFAVNPSVKLRPGVVVVGKSLLLLPPTHSLRQGLCDTVSGNGMPTPPMLRPCTPLPTPSPVPAPWPRELPLFPCATAICPHSPHCGHRATPCHPVMAHMASSPCPPHGMAVAPLFLSLRRGRVAVSKGSRLVSSRRTVHAGPPSARERND